MGCVWPVLAYSGQERTPDLTASYFQVIQSKEPVFIQAADLSVLHIRSDGQLDPEQTASAV